MIGIYGGTFDPVHYGHLRTALDVKTALGLTEVRMLPCSQPAHRSQPGVSSTMRLAMLRLAVADVSGFKVDARELERAGPSYMVDTLQSLRVEIPDRPLLLIIGTDAFGLLDTWHQWQRLFDYAHIVVMRRPGSQPEKEPLQAFLSNKLTGSVADLQTLSCGHLFFQPVTQLDISATRIRQMIADDESPQFLLPDPVVGYIRQNKLYTGN